jgi:ribosomal protein L37E
VSDAKAHHGPHGDDAAVLFARRCTACGWLDQRREWEREEEAAVADGDWRCQRCGSDAFDVVSTVGG